jgi:hypothetical protein
MSDTQSTTASAWAGKAASPQKMFSSSAVIIMVFPLPVGAEKEIACGLSIEANLRAADTLTRKSASASS